MENNLTFVGLFDVGDGSSRGEVYIHNDSPNIVVLGDGLTGTKQQVGQLGFVPCECNTEEVEIQKTLDPLLFKDTMYFEERGFLVEKTKVNVVRRFLEMFEHWKRHDKFDDHGVDNFKKVWRPYR